MSNSTINNIPTLVQIMAWGRPGDKPLSEPMMIILLTLICVTRAQWGNIYACADILWFDATHPVLRERAPRTWSENNQYLKYDIGHCPKHWHGNFVIFVTGCSGSCYFDNFWNSQCCKFRQNDNISVSVNINTKFHTTVTNKNSLAVHIQFYCKSTKVSSSLLL